MSIRQSFLRHILSQLSPKRRGRRPSLGLEILEDRAVPATFYVRTDGSNANTGLSPTQAVASIQLAINMAKTLAIGSPSQDNNTVDVASGTYSYNDGLATDSKSLGFPAVVGVVDQQLTIAGGFNSSFTAVAGQSIIDGSALVRGVSVLATSRPTSITLSGFTIQNCIAAPQTSANTLTAFGGGMFIDMGALQSSNPTDTISNVVFRNNTAKGAANTSSTVNNGAGGEGSGGGLAAIFANNVQLNNVTFDSNSALGGNGPIRGGSGLGGALYGGEGAHFGGQNISFTNNKATGGNSTSVGTENGKFAEGFGGAVCLLGASSGQALPSPTSVTFSNVNATGNIGQGGNSGSGANDLAGFARGGAFYSENALVSLTDSTLSGNKAAGGTATNGGTADIGGAIYATAFNTDVTITLNRVSVLNNSVVGATVTGTPSAVLGGGLGADRANGHNLTVNVLNTVIAGNVVMAPGAVAASSGGGGVWSDDVTVNLTHTTIADNAIPTASMTGSAILVYRGTENLAYSIIANESGTQPAVAILQGGAVNLTGVDLFAKVTTTGLPAQANLVTAPDAKFNNSTARDYSLQSGSPAIDAATGSTTKVDRLNLKRVSTPDIGAYEFGGLSPAAVAAKLGAYRSSDGSWSLDSDGNFGFNAATDQVFQNFSQPGVIGVAGDWNGTGNANIGDFKDGVWHLDLNGDGRVDPSGTETFQFGQAGDKPIVGDWTGDGKTKLGVFRAAADGITGEFVLDTNNDHQIDVGDTIFTFGYATDRIIVGDWTGDGISKVGVFRDATSFGAAGAAVFSLDAGNHHTFDSTSQVFVYGLITDGVVIGDWNGNGIAKVGVYRDGAAGYNAAGTGLFSLDTNGNLQFDPTDNVFLYGLTTDQFVAGNWKRTPPLQPR